MNIQYKKRFTCGSVIKLQKKDEKINIKYRKTGKKIPSVFLKRKTVRIQIKRLFSRDVYYYIVYYKCVCRVRVYSDSSKIPMLLKKG